MLTAADDGGGHSDEKAQHCGAVDGKHLAFHAQPRMSRDVHLNAAAEPIFRANKFAAAQMLSDSQSCIRIIHSACDRRTAFCQDGVGWNIIMNVRHFKLWYYANGLLIRHATSEQRESTVLARYLSNHDHSRRTWFYVMAHGWQRTADAPVLRHIQYSVVSSTKLRPKHYRLAYCNASAGRCGADVFAKYAKSREAR